MRIALVAHDHRKPDMLLFAERHKAFLEGQELTGTATTGKLLAEHLDLKVRIVLSGPMGGDAQISALAAVGELDAIIFLRDPLTAQPHEPDISALLRICDVHNIPLATNMGTAEHLLLSLAHRSKENTARTSPITSRR